MEGRLVIRDLTWWIWASSLWGLSQGIWFNLPSTGSKCVSEEIQGNVVVLADYYLIHEDHNNVDTTLSLKVTSPYGNILHHNENVTSYGQFAFTTHEAGNYLACFQTQGGTHTSGADVSVNLDWKTGIAAKDWDSVAKKEKIVGVELELKKLEESVIAIHENLIYLKNRETEMREVSEKTNTRVALCSMLSLTVCIAVSTLQILYLKRYFRKKKLI